jgi:hypothetical protein
MDPKAYFHDDSCSATMRFREIAAAGGVRVDEYLHPLKGPSGEDLFTLACQIGPPDAPNVMVLTSGVHGTEAMVGAGLQAWAIDRSEDLLAAAPNTRLVLTHIINPWGAAHGRYVNEDNVDLNKNITYGADSPPADPIFLEFDDAIDLKAVTDEAAYEAVFRPRRALVAKYGAERVMAAFKKGQRERPQSICYNGVSDSWSKITLETILAKGLAGARRVLYVDLHSGMGDWGEAYVVTGGDATSQALARGWLGAAAHDSDLPMTIPQYSPLARFAPGADYAALTIEGGTAVFDTEFNKMMWLEMHFQMFGDPNCAKAREIRRKFKAYYYPETDEWKQEFWKNGSRMLKFLAEKVETWPTAPAAAA